MVTQPVLLPLPRQIKFPGDFTNLADRKLILLDCPHPQSLLFSAGLIQKALLDQMDMKCEITASFAVPKNLVGITLRLDPGLTVNSQGYTLHLAPENITVQAKDEAGLFYGCCTLLQIIHYDGLMNAKGDQHPQGSLTCLEIIDWPDFTNRGYMLDVSRDKVPTMETLFNLVDLLASWKVNQLQLYTEHTFAYQNHPDVWAEASPFTGEEILELDAYCRQRYIELVPNQNSFGHLEHWLVHPRYKSLAESPEGFDLPREHHAEPYSLCPLDPGSLALVASLYDELLPHFSSRQLNVGCDETFDLGLGRSKDACEQLGTGRVYLDFLLKIYQAVTQRGFKMQFWGDIIMAHPELVDELPRDCIALDWGYEADAPFEEHAARFSEARVPFYVCPGTSSWNSIAGRTDNCLRNICNAAASGMKYGASGLLNTDWGDNGYWQALPVSYLGIAEGAACSWAYEANQALDIRSALSIYAFQDPTNSYGNIAYDLGNVYKETRVELINSSALFEIMQRPVSAWQEYPGVENPIPVFTHTLEVIDRIAARIPEATSRRIDSALVKREFQLTVNLLRHACQRGLFGYGSGAFSAHALANDLKKILSEYKEIWLLRNRPGGLKDSLAHFEAALSDYR